MKQHGLSILTAIQPGKAQVLQALLNEIGTHIDEKPHGIDFYEIKTVHFMRWVVVPAGEVRGEKVPAWLVLSTNYDGPLHTHLSELVSRAMNGLREIYAHCDGFQPEWDAQAIVQYLRKHSHKTAAFYNGHVGRDLSQITHENYLQTAIQARIQHLNPQPNWKDKSAVSIREEILSEFKDKKPWEWTRQPYRDTFMQRFGIPVLGLVVLLGIAIYVLGFLYLPLVTGIILGAKTLIITSWFIILRMHEKRDAAQFIPPPRDAAKVSALTAREDYKNQNQITHLVNIKPGIFRQATIRFILGAINLLAKTLFNKGNLGGIPSIHFARWVILDGGKRLLFFSNFDGSWESYLGDFVDKASIGLTGVWSNTVGFPPTRFLIKAGARNEENFKAWVRQQQIETQVWYSGYKTLSVLNINNNTRIRQGMVGKMNEKKAAKWLKKL